MGQRRAAIGAAGVSRTAKNAHQPPFALSLSKGR